MSAASLTPGCSPHGRRSLTGRFRAWVGDRGEPRTCPVARAIRKALPGARVRVHPAVVLVAFAGVRYIGVLPPFMSARVLEFDGGAPWGPPVSFELSLFEAV